MRIAGQEISFFIETVHDNSDMLLGINLMNGVCEGCGEPAVGIQLGLLFLTFTITITAAH
jgi:hypothetical protein